MWLRFSVLLIAALVCVPSAKADGPGALGVSPTNILFDGRTRSAEVTLINRGSETATYRLSFQNLRMLESGAYETVETLRDNEHPADSMIRYSPRQVRIEGGGSQTVRLLLRKPAGLPAGEYRSHLLMQQLPPENSGNDIDTSLGPEQLSVKLIAMYGVSIPVIVREGALEATAELRDVKLLDPVDPSAGKLLELSIARQGNASVRGDIAAEFEPAGGGKRVRVGIIKGLSVLYPTEQRVVRFHLTHPDGEALSRGALHLRYVEGEEAAGARLLASAELALP